MDFGIFVATATIHYSVNTECIEILKAAQIVQFNLLKKNK